MSVISTNAYGDIDLRTYSSRWWFGSDSSVYGYVFNDGEYVFIPDDVISKGFVDKNTNKQYYLNNALNKSTITDLYTKYQPIDFGGFKGFDYSDKFYNRLTEMGYGTSGILIPATEGWKIVGETWKTYDIGREVGNVTVGAIQGMGEKDGQLVYIPTSSGADQATAWIQNDGKTYAQWMPELKWYQKLAQEIAKIPLFPELASLAIAAIPGGEAYAPYVYAALKGAALGAQGVDPLKAGLMVGINLAAQNLAANTTFAKGIGASFGAVSEPMQLAIGKAVIGASVNGVRAAVAGGDVTKAMLEGAITAGGSSTVAELSKSVLGADAQTKIADIAKSTNLTSTQIQTIVASSFVSGIVSEMKGGDFTTTFKNSLVGAGIGQSAANAISDNLPNNISAETRKAIVTGTSTVAGTAAVAMINGQDINKALESNLPSIIYTTMNSYNEQIKNEADAKKAGWANYAEQAVAQAKYGAAITPSDYKTKEQFIADVKEFTYDGSKAETIDQAKKDAIAAGYNTFYGPDKKIYTIGGQSLSSMDTFVQAMAPGFDPDAYKKINKLDSGVNAAEHYLDIGQYKNFPVSYENYVDKTFSVLPEYKDVSAKDFYKEERDAAIAAAKSGDFSKVDDIAKFINKSFTTNEEATKYLKDAYAAVGLPNRVPTAKELDMVRGKDEVNAYTIAQVVSAIGATTFDGTKYATPQLAEKAAKAAGYNTFDANDGNTYRVMSVLDEANIRANVEDQKTFKDAFNLARTQLGDGKTFTWNGKQYTTNVLPTDTYDASRSGSLESAATLAYANGKMKFIGPDGKTYAIPDSAKSILDNAVNQSPAETQRLLRQAVTPIQDEYAAETQRLMESGKRGVMDNISAMTSQALGTTQRGIANLISNAGKTYAAITGDLSFNNAATRFGSELESYAKQRDIYGIDVQKNRIQQALQQANETDGFWNKAKIIGSAIAKNPIGFFDIAGSEAVEEIPETAVQIGIVLGTGGLGAGALVGIGAVSAAGSFIEAFGNGAEDAYKMSKQRGDSDEVARDKAYINGVVATVSETIPEIIADKALIAPFAKSLATSLAGTMAGYASSAAVGMASEFASGFSQSYAQQLIVDPSRANVSKALTDGIYEMYIGGAVQSALSAPGYAYQGSTIIGRDYLGKNVTFDEVANNLKVVDSSTVNPSLIIGKTKNGTDLTIGGAIMLLPEVNFNPSILQTYAPQIFNNPNLVVGRDALGNNVTYSAIASKVDTKNTYKDIFNKTIDITPAEKVDAQKIFLKDQFKAIGYAPTDAQINSLITTNPTGSDAFTTSAKKLAFNDIAKQENYSFGINELNNLLSPYSAIKTVDQLRASLDPKTVTAEEARQFFLDQGYTKPTDAQVQNLVTKFTTRTAIIPVYDPYMGDWVITFQNETVPIGFNETQAKTEAAKIADPYVFDAEEIKAVAASEGYTITDDQARALAREANEASASALYRTEIDPLAVTKAEATEFFKTFGYVPNADEINRFTLSKPESEIKLDMQSYIEPHQVTQAEVEQAFKDLGYTATPEEMAQFVRGNIDVDQAAVMDELSKYVDPRYVTEAEVRAAYSSLGLEQPTQADVNKLIGQYAQSELATKAEESLPLATANYLVEQFKGLATAQESILTKMQENEKAGQDRDTALNNAINDVATELGVTRDQLSAQIGTPLKVDNPNTAEDESAPPTGIYKVISDFEEQTKLAQKELQDQIAANEAARQADIKRQADEARSKDLFQRASNLLGIPLAGAAAAPFIAPETKFDWKKPFITSTTKQEEFQGPLEEFQKEVAQGSYLQPSFGEEEPQMRKFMGMEENKEGEPMPNYFTYGQQTDIDQLFNPFGPKATSFNEFEPFASASGGLVPPLMATGGLIPHYARGGLPVVAHSGKARLDFRTGAAVTGPGDGQSDDIPAMLADGEFVIPADVVAALGNGSTKAGSDKLYDMMHSVRAHHRSARPQDLPPPAKSSPLDYLKKSRR